MHSLHISKVLMLMERAAENKTKFDLQFVKLSTGELVDAIAVYQTSSNYKNRTRNIRFPDSGEIRKIRNILITKFNNISVYV